MAISPDLFSAILAMDAYNRGDGAKLLVSGPIRDASILDLPLPEGSSESSFFATAYTLSNGQTIISFRGTDDPADILTGWAQGIGYTSSQAILAFRFYQQLQGANIYNANIELVGHSLGAGLAGLIADIYGKQAAL